MDSKANAPRTIAPRATGKRRARSVEMLPRFKKALQTYCEPQGISVSKHEGSRPSDNVMKLVSTSGQSIVRVLYVKVRGSGVGFWGLTANQINAIRGQGHQWDVVLLLGSGERSYLGTSQMVEEGFKKWSSSAAGDYKVHESEIEGWFAHFDSYAELFFRLLPPATLEQTVALNRTSPRTLGPGVSCGDSGAITTQFSRRH